MKSSKVFDTNKTHRKSSKSSDSHEDLEQISHISAVRKIRIHMKTSKMFETKKELENN